MRGKEISWKTSVVVQQKVVEARIERAVNSVHLAKTFSYWVMRIREGRSGGRIN